MPTTKLPATPKLWKPIYYGQWNGDFVDSFNLNLTRKIGHIALTNSYRPHTTNAENFDMTVTPSDFIKLSLKASPYIDNWYAAGAKLYRTDNLFTTVFSGDNITGTPSSITGTDADIKSLSKNASGFDIAVVSLQGELAEYNYDENYNAGREWNPTWWTVTLAQPALITGSHPLEVFDSNQPLLLIGDKFKLHSVQLNADYTYTTINTRVIFPNNYTMNWIKSTKDKIYIGLNNDKGDSFPSLFIEYDPFQEQTRAVRVDEGKTIGYVSRNAIFIVDYKGNIKQWTGYEFSVVNSFPSAYIPNGYVEIHRNGIHNFENRIRFLLNGLPFFPTSNSQPDYQRGVGGGIWVLDLDTNNLYRESSFRQADFLYFGSTIKKSDALPFKALRHFPDATNGFNVLCGVGLAASSGASSIGIYSRRFTYFAFGNANSLDRGWFISPKIAGPEIETRWRNLLIQYSWIKDFGSANNGVIIAKYKNVEVDNLSGYLLTGTWATGNTFTINVAFLPTETAIGDEIFILGQGHGAGLSTHISDIAGTTTKTITIDETLGSTPSGTFLFTIDRWVKISPIISDNKEGWAMLDLSSEASDWIQFKIEIRGGLIIDELAVGYQPSLIQEPSQTYA